jgi:pimeloyl-ACP methyl ester carboxylesterase
VHGPVPHTNRPAGAARSVVLPDGRSLEFATYGDRGGAPVVAIHGRPGTHALWVPGHATAAVHGVRLVAPSRPGCGASSPSADAAVADDPFDVAVLADALGLGAFALLGLGDGGRYAADCARALPDLVTRLALLDEATVLAVPTSEDSPSEERAVRVPVRQWTGRVDDGDCFGAVCRWLAESCGSLARPRGDELDG